MIYWLGSFHGDLVVKRRLARCRLMPGPRGAAAHNPWPEGTAGGRRDREGRGSLGPASHVGAPGRRTCGGGCSCARRGEDRERSGLGRAECRRGPSRWALRLTLAAAGSFWAEPPGFIPGAPEAGARDQRGSREAWRRVPGRGPECGSSGQRGNPGRLLQPPAAAGLRAALQPPPPVPAAARAARPRSHSEPPGRRLPALCGAGAR